MASVENTGGSATHVESAELAPVSMDSGVSYPIEHGRIESSESGIERPQVVEGSFRDRPLHEFREDHPGEFVEPIGRSYPIERFSDTDELVQRINPEYHDGTDRYDRNCADCARSFERSWRGDFEEAAGRAPQLDDSGRVEPHGEPATETEEWADERFTETTEPDDLRTALVEGGHGSSAIVHTYFDDADGAPGGHAYNVVNERGRITVCDAQIHRTFDWTEGTIHPLVGDRPEHLSMAWNSNGERIW
jgi:hypothetical protein